MINYDVLEYVRPDGRSPFAEWLGSLVSTAAIKVTSSLHKMRHGNFSNSKSLGGGVWEFKIGSGPGYRIYYGKIGETVILLLAGGTKKGQQKDIKLSKELLKEYKKKTLH